MTELQDIFKTYKDEYLRNHKVSAQQLKVMNALINCRTAALGAHIDSRQQFPAIRRLFSRDFR